jgi:hypothetical protein
MKRQHDDGRGSEGWILGGKNFFLKLKFFVHRLLVVSIISARKILFPKKSRVLKINITMLKIKKKVEQD